MILTTQHILEARTLAEQKHFYQRYGNEPYINHIQGVVDTLPLISQYIPKAFFHQAQIVAYLHDILEDTDLGETYIYNHFGSDVLVAVRALTKLPNESRDDYINRLIASQNTIAIIIKMADTMYNLRKSLESGNMGFINRYTKQLIRLMSYFRHD